MQYNWSRHSPAHSEPVIWDGYWPDSSNKRRDLLQRFFNSGRGRHHRRPGWVPNDQPHIGPLVARTLKNLIQEFHWIWCMRELSNAQLVTSVDQKSRRNAYPVRHVIVLLPRTFLIGTVSLRKHSNQPRRRFQKRL